MISKEDLVVILACFAIVASSVVGCINTHEHEIPLEESSDEDCDH